MVEWEGSTAIVLNILWVMVMQWNVYGDTDAGDIRSNIEEEDIRRWLENKGGPVGTSVLRITAREAI